MPKMETSEEYKCSKCEKNGVKLWRVGGSSHVELFCIDCAFENQKDWILDQVKKSFLSGQVEFVNRGTDQIGGCLVPAVPDGDGNWWGYTSVPDDGCRWWHSLEPMMALGKAYNVHQAYKEEP